MTADLLALVNDLRARVAELERVQQAGGMDRHLSLEEVALRIGPRKSASTLRRWIRSAAMRRRLRLDTLLLRDPSGRWYSTARIVDRWQRDVIRNLKAGGGASAEENAQRVSAASRLIRRFASVTPGISVVRREPPPEAPGGASSAGSDGEER